MRVVRAGYQYQIDNRLAPCVSGSYGAENSHYTEHVKVQTSLANQKHANMSMERVVIDDAEFELLPSIWNELDFVLPLSAPPSPLIGRESIVLSLIEKINDPDIRLLTLTGAGGIGKTRLALAVAWQLDRAVAFVPLAPIARPDPVAATIAQVIGLEPISNSHAFVTLRDALRDRSLVLMLDNFEHLSQASLLVSDLLAACPKLTILVTSRSRLAISGERVIPIEPLKLPANSNLAEIDESEAVRLFVARSREAYPEFTLNANNCDTVARVCASLDGLPLAIELAAARSNLLSPQALAARLEHRLQFLNDGPNDLPARLQTMRAAIAWSVDLLKAAERQIWEHLGVYSGGFTLEAVESLVTELGFDDRDGLALVQSLIDQGLIRQITNKIGEPRFGMLETTREYAVELLRAGERESEARRLHAAHLETWSRVLQVGLKSRDASPWQGRTESELANLRLAITWFRDRDQIERAMGIVERLQWFWTIPSFIGEGRQLCHDLLERHSTGIDPMTLASVLDTAGTLALWHTDADAAMEHYLGALEIWRRENTTERLAAALVGLGSASIDALEFERAESWLHEAFEIATIQNDHWAAGGSANLLGVAAVARNDFQRALTHHETALRLFYQGGYGAHSRGALSGLALAYLNLGEYQRAWENYEAVISLCSVEELYSHVPTAIDGFAEIALKTRQTDLAVSLFGVASAQRAQLALPTRPHMASRRETLVTEARTAVGDARFTLLWTRAQSLSISESFDLARSVQTPVPHVEDGLTRREHEVLQLLVEGTADTEIADQLFISRRTASKHVAAILDKLGAANRTAAATIAFRRGMIRGQ